MVMMPWQSQSLQSGGNFRKNGEEIDYDKLRRDGYSKAMIARLKAL